MGKKIRLIHLHHFLFENYQTIRKILQYDPHLENLYQYSPSTFQNIFQMTLKAAEKLYDQLHSTSILDILKENYKKNIIIITIYDELYPDLLKEICDPPFVLYLKGNQTILKKQFLISIIGAREPSLFAKIICDSLIIDLMKEDCVIVSGMATGCDSIAHKSAIFHRGKTIAVVGCGLDYIYPKQNRNLFNEISINHLVISEYPYYIKPEKRYFPRRNRIIAGLSKGLIVLEAKEKSGTMITANFAIQYNREVFAVPGPIIMEEYKGNHRLIQDGAKLITNTNDILEEFKEYTKK
ncbi:DNA-processing protein DprA [Bacillus sp. AFS041924]|uniref:DNA-processing protein DprA n=1 Tax=Bacillus sp. AFS041924 TaxID=2033503 RepID=UPI000BFDFC2D|nr:DNA-processing protein DprA [Bacillus sp. AFS041924]PGS50716.1 DNA-protecting protein DprA [Bacillus sp. AFS041924]